MAPAFTLIIPTALVVWLLKNTPELENYQHDFFWEHLQRFREKLA